MNDATPDYGMKYRDQAAVTIRNLITVETDAYILRQMTQDKRKIIADKATRRLAQLAKVEEELPEPQAGGPGLTVEETIAAYPNVVAKAAELVALAESGATLAELVEHVHQVPPLDDAPVTPGLDDGPNTLEAFGKLLEVAEETGLAAPAERLINAIVSERGEPHLAPLPEGAAGRVRKRSARRKNEDASPVVSDPVTATTKCCPRCGETKDIGSGFGWRKLTRAAREGGGKRLAPQPQCYACRKLPPLNPRPASILARQEKAERKAKREALAAARKQERAELAALKQLNKQAAAEARQAEVSE